MKNIAIAADGKDLTYIYYEIVDSEEWYQSANNLVRLHCTDKVNWLVLIMGNKPAVNATRHNLMVLIQSSTGLPLLNQLEQAGKFTLTAHSDLLNWSSNGLYW